MDPTSPNQFSAQLNQPMPVPVGGNPQNSMLLLLQRLMSQANAAKAADVPVTADQAGALGIPTKQKVPNVQPPPSS